MKKNFIVVGIVLAILATSLVSAGWFTGNAIWDGNFCSNKKQCNEKEGDCDSNSHCKTGYCAKNVGLKYQKRKGMDVCECPLDTEWDEASESCLGDGLTCSVVDDVVRDGEGKKYKNFCNGTDYVEYSCDGPNVKPETTNCPGKCDLGKGGCVNVCTGETDSANNVDIAGAVTLENGEVVKDKCISGKTIKQFACVNLVFEVVGTKNCGPGRECYDNGGKDAAYCRDMIAGTATISSLQSEIASLKTLIEALTARIEALEA